jgi:hypothetical protein
VIVIDTGPVVAAANRKDDHHEQCVELLQGFPGPPGTLAAGARYSLTGVSAADSDELGRDAALWESRRAEIERAARVAGAFTTVEAVTAVETAEP